MLNKVLLSVFTASALLLSGCASTLTGDTYSRSEARRMQTVQFGTVTDTRLVKIEGNQSGLGAVPGAVVGGIAGSTIGGGRGQGIATVLGAVGGAIAGSAIEKQVTTAQGVSLTIRLDSGQHVSVVQEIGPNDRFQVGDRVQVLTGPDGSARANRI
ncbi:glycine zipper 2TM domain-containing protein [Balneatrix alpica]|uniref:Glycine zipper 2TM domain-containing protein n=1 Tax=Balneatrix alpica TaxID=75684 RepID=A0ABV5Z9G4_9GAMM|nr:glycine zipper 2TM domain-containing protein [Balneatrix alpica]